MTAKRKTHRPEVVEPSKPATTEPQTSEPKVIEGLVEGRMVHFVLPSGKHRPAVVVQVWDHGTGCSNLQVLTDGENDGSEAQYVSGLLRVTSILYSEEPKPHTWHWIERA